MNDSFRKINFTGNYQTPISYIEFKNSLDNGRKKILLDYENDIINFLTIMNEQNFLITEFDDAQIKRLILLGEKDQVVNLLIHNSNNYFSNITDPDFNQNFEFIQKYIQTLGFDFNRFHEQSLVLITMAYVYNIEYMKKIMTFIINYNELGLKDYEKKIFWHFDSKNQGT